LETYKEKDDCMSVISDEYDTALSDSTQDAFDSIKDNISKIIRLKYEDEVIINLSAFLIYLKEFDGQFFTKDEEKFRENIKNLLENILEENNEVNNTDQIYDAIYDAKYENLNVNNRRILEKISQNISSAFSDYSDENPSHDYDDDDEQPYGDVKQIAKLKSEIIAFFNKTIKSLGQDPDNNVIQNEIVRIEFDKQRFNLNGKIWAHITDLRNKKGYEGYINIKDIPTYFKTYKLHEEILKIKRLF
jgi:hypothetical protein